MEVEHAVNYDKNIIVLMVPIADSNRQGGRGRGARGRVGRVFVAGHER